MKAEMLCCLSDSLPRNKVAINGLVDEMDEALLSYVEMDGPAETQL